MKNGLLCIGLCLGLGPLARADSLKPQNVAPDTKWLVHLDCDSLRQSQLGGYFLNRLVLPKADEMASGLKINASNILQHVSSITAFGDTFTKGADATGVLMINSDGETQKAIEGLLVAQILANTNGPIKKLDDVDHPLYSFGGQVYIAPQEGGPIIVSKSQSKIDLTRELLTKKATGAPTGKIFSDFPIISNSFIFVGVADAIDIPNPLPAQAKILQMADGGRVALGERDDRVFLDISLRGKTAEVTRQIQQVIEGMVALVKIGQSENQDLMELANSTKVSSTAQLISVNFDYPVSKVITRINEEMTPKPHKAKAPRQKSGLKAKPKADVQAEDPAPESEAKGSAKEAP